MFYWSTINRKALFVKMTVSNSRAACGLFRKYYRLFPGKPSPRIFNRYQFNLFHRETLVYHSRHDVVNDMRVSVSAEMYLKELTKYFYI